MAEISTARRFLLIYAAAAICVIGSGVFFYAGNRAALIRKNGQQLENIAVFKIEEISDWVRERKDDTLSLTDSPILSTYFAAFAAKPTDSGLRALLKDRLANYLNHNRHYYSAAVTDVKGRPLITVGEPSGPLQPEEARVLKLAAAGRGPVLSDFYTPAGERRPRLCITAPAAADRPVNLYLRLLINPEVFLYPRVLLWPAKSGSAETLIVRREGDQLLYLNRLRFDPGAALKLRLPVSESSLPAAMAVKGYKGTVEGIDYRGRKVLAYVDSIPEPGWGLVTKIDKDEVLAPTRTTGLLLLIIIVIVLAGTGGLLFALARRGETDLARSEDKFRLFFENSALGKSITEIDGRVSVNKAFCDMLGYDANELRGKKWQEITHPEDINETAAVIKSMLEGKRASVRYEKRFVHKSGRVVCAEITSTLQRDPGGRPEYFLTSVSDITDRKRMEKALRESETRYREIVELAVDGILLGSPEGKIVAANTQMQKLAGRTLEELLGLHVSALFAPEELHAKPLKFDELKEGGTVFSERNLRRPDGSSLSVEMHSKRMPDGTYQSIYRDVTERRKAEEALREAQEMAHLGYWDWEVKTGAVKWSEEVYRIFRLNPEEFTPRIDSILELSPWPEDHERGKELIRRAVASREKGSYDQRFLRPDKSTGYYTSTFQGKYDDKGDLISIVGTVLDITTRKSAELETERLNRDLAEKKQEMENFLYITTHDLRSPLVNIQGFSQNLDGYIAELHRLLAPAPLPPGTRAELERLTGDRIPGALKFVIESSRKLDSLITALLKVSRLGRVQMKPEPVDMNRLLNNILDSLRFQLETAGGEIKCGDFPPCEADPGAVSQLFSNLLDNAIKYRSRDRALKVSLSGKITGNTVIYAVADNGSGIPEDDLHRVWDLFYRPERAAGGKGEGIGLAMVKRIAEKNGGSIRAESREGEGSTFYVELPAAGRRGKWETTT